MEHVIPIKPCGSTVTTTTHDTVNTGDNTVRHCNGVKDYSARRSSSKGRSEISLRYSDDLGHTMRSCIGKIDEQHKRGNSKPRERARRNSANDRRGSGWANFFTCCGDSTELPTLAPPDLGESAVTDDESESVSSRGSLDAILDHSCALEDAMLLETAKRDTLESDSLRRKKRWRGHLKAASSLDKGFAFKTPPVPSRKPAPRDITSLLVGNQWQSERWRSNTKKDRRLSAGEHSEYIDGHPPPSPKRLPAEDNSNLGRSERWRSNTKMNRSFSAIEHSESSDGHPPPSPKRLPAENNSNLGRSERWRSNIKMNRSLSATEHSESSTKLLTDSKLRNTESSDGHPPPSMKTLSAEDNSSLVLRRRSRSQSMSGTARLGNAPSSPRDIMSSDVEERWRSHLKMRKSDSADEQSPASSMKSHTKDKHSKHDITELGDGCPPLSPKKSPVGDNPNLIIGRRSRSHSRSENGTMGHTHPPPSPNKSSLEEIAGLDMLVELQKEEARIENKLPHDDKKGSFRRTRRQSFRKTKSVKSVKSERSIFSFAEEDTVLLSKDADIKIQHIYGPPCGSYENISTGNHSPYNSTEVNNTYSTYRMDPHFVQKIMSRLTFSLPLYHTLPPNPSTKILKHVCSEPIASDFRVRGPTYITDSEKIPSRETMFSILGANNVLRRKSEPHGPSNGSEHFLTNFRAACQQASFNTPFILIVNFIVPWGNFSSYYYRPNGTDGSPFSESESEQPSEKLWRTFLHGDEVSTFFHTRADGTGRLSLYLPIFVYYSLWLTSTAIPK